MRVSITDDEREMLSSVGDYHALDIPVWASVVTASPIDLCSKAYSAFASLSSCGTEAHA